MSSWLWFAVIAYLVIGLVIFPLSKRFPKHLGPAREFMEFLVIFTSGSIIVTLIVWALWLPAMIFSLLIPSNTLEYCLRAGAARRSKEKSELIGLEARCLTDLKPSGKIEIKGQPHEAICINDFIMKGCRVRIKQQQGFCLVVEKID